jgi:hypothetical protein
MILKQSKPRAQADAYVYRDVEVFSRIRAAECLISLNRPAEARSEIARILEIANCPDCETTSREIDRSRLRAEVLLLQLDEIAPANAGASR